MRQQRQYKRQNDKLNTTMNKTTTTTTRQIIIFIGAELVGAAGARAPPLLHNPRNFIV